MHKFRVTVNIDGKLHKYHAIGKLGDIQDEAYDRFGVCSVSVIAL